MNKPFRVCLLTVLLNFPACVGEAKRKGRWQTGIDPDSKSGVLFTLPGTNRNLNERNYW